MSAPPPAGATSRTAHSRSRPAGSHKRPPAAAAPPWSRTRAKPVPRRPPASRRPSCRRPARPDGSPAARSAPARTATSHAKPARRGRLAVIDAGRAAARCAPRNPGNADGRQRTPDHRLGAHDQAVKAGDRQLVAEFHAADRDHSREQQQAELLPRAHHLSPIRKLLGRSLMSLIFARSPSSICFAPAGAAKLKPVDATSLPVFQSRIWMLYSGLPATTLDAMSYRHG